MSAAAVVRVGHSPEPKSALRKKGRSGAPFFAHCLAHWLSARLERNPGKAPGIAVPAEYRMPIVSIHVLALPRLPRLPSVRLFARSLGTNRRSWPPEGNPWPTSSFPCLAVVHFPVHRYDATLRPTAHHDIASSLTFLLETQSFQRADTFGTGQMGQLRHAREH